MKNRQDKNKPNKQTVKALLECERIAVWNEAIEAAVKKLKKDFVAPEVVIEIIREVKR